MKIKMIILLSLSIFFLSACGTSKDSAFQMQSFTYTDQNGQPFGVENLKGKVWIANFIFTNCVTVCPPMSASMASLQAQIKKENLQVEFVSFSVDPTVDTPEALKKFVKKFTTDDSNWHLLTGYGQKEIETFAREEFQTLIQKPKSTDQVIHSTSFYLIDQNGKVIDNFGFQKSHFSEILNEIRKLAPEV